MKQQISLERLCRVVYSLGVEQGVHDYEKIKERLKTEYGMNVYADIGQEEVQRFLPGLLEQFEIK